MPRDVASRNAKAVCDEGRGVGDTRLSVYLDFADAIKRLGADTIKARYGNLFDMYKRITDEDPYKVPMRIYPAVHYTMGGLWVDYNLMSNLPGLHVLGEANFSDHGANRLGASALMQGLCDGYFVIPYTLGHYLAGTTLEPVTTAHEAFGEAAAVGHRAAGPAAGGQGHALDSRLPSRDRPHPLGQGRHVAHRRRAATGDRGDPRAARASSGRTSRCPASKTYVNQALDYAGRVADYLEFGELLALDALHRTESCGGHFREESQTPDGEALRDDEHFSYVAAWEFGGVGQAPTLHQEPLVVGEREADPEELQIVLSAEC